ncbi:tryptophan-rich sensory protein, partial [Patescibacteria group bacterium]|nr:tryptophan-rich sensory protein [Patescibacteria group bacterium]
MQKNNNLFLKIGVAISYVGMVAVNVMATALPINGVTTGEASDRFANLFTPAGITFSIWGLIYILLAIYTVYQFDFIQKHQDDKKTVIYNKIRIFFIISSLTNMAWIFAWHYGVIWLSVLIMLALLTSLIIISDTINKLTLSKIEKIYICLPFSVYFGWITVATIANITVFLVSLNWSGFGISEQIWTVIILLIGALIGILRMLKDKKIPYGLVLIWAYAGILIKHTSDNGFANQYPTIIYTTILCIVLYIFTSGLLLKQ